MIHHTTGAMIGTFSYGPPVVVPCRSITVLSATRWIRRCVDGIAPLFARLGESDSFQGWHGGGAIARVYPHCLESLFAVVATTVFPPALACRKNGASVDTLLQRGYTVLALTTTHKAKCWSEAHVPMVHQALQEFIQQQQQPYNPVVASDSSNSTIIIAVGASSGGWMAARLAVEGMVHAGLVLVMVTALRQALRHRSIEPRTASPTPPFLGTHARRPGYRGRGPRRAWIRQGIDPQIRPKRTIDVCVG